MVRSAAGARGGARTGLRYELIVVAVASLVFLANSVSPPALMDDVDAVQAQIARNMLESGDWVTARLNGVAYLEKAPLIYWMMAASFAVFGVADWAARLPVALSVVALCWLTARIGRWAFSPLAGLYAGLSLATCAGLFLFTRILIPDVVLTLAITFAMWSLLRALEGGGRAWAMAFWSAIGAGFLLKGLIAVVFPVAAAALYLTIAGRWRDGTRLRPLPGALLFLAIAAPWVALATLRNPPYFDLTMRSEPGQYRGFFWFFFLNEHLFRFLDMRHPRDYNTVPRAAFWLFHLLWLFPWSAYLPAAARLGFRPVDRAGALRLLALCWIVFILVFFTFSTTQEYYSMPCYPAFALLIGAAIAEGGAWVRRGARAIGAISAAAAAVLIGLWWLSRDLPAPGDISRALTLNPEAYTLSLGHLKDLTLGAFAYLRAPLLVAAAALVAGAIGSSRRWLPAAVVMMILFTHAARMALVVFDPYLSSRALAEALARAPEGRVVFDNQYYTFSSVFFYTNKRGYLLNGRVNNLEYGSYAPGAPPVFIDDAVFAQMWRESRRTYILVEGPSRARIESLAGNSRVVAESGGKFLLANE
jgi:4-amino-4-deoxy-L-arabinose transferase-like glycosyltransferase